MKTLNIISAILILMMTGCRPEPLDIDLPQAETKLVVASQVIPNSIMIVVVSKSFGALDYSDDYDTSSVSPLTKILVENAKVTISYNGVTDDLYPVSDAPGLYFSLTTPQYINTEYTLKVYDPETGLSVSSTARMLDQVLLDDVTAKKGDGKDSNDIKIHFKFTDPAGEKNWYMLNFYNPNDTAQSSGGLFEPKTSEYYTLLLSDEMFDTEEISGDITMYQWTTDTIGVSLSNISEGYFNYLSARKRGGRIISSLMHEPINYPTNIEGGYGFFTTHFPDIRLVKVED